MSEYKISIIGSGNVATHLSLALHKAGHEIVSVYSRTKANARILANKINAEVSDTIVSDKQPDIYIVSVSDDAISEVSRELKEEKGIVMHTSGSVGIDILTDNIKRCGVLYPLQTFSVKKSVEMNSVPFFIEASDNTVLDTIQNLAQSVTQKVTVADSRERMLLHISAVFACNFTNHMFAIADSILNSAGLSIDIIKPLINETVEKIDKLSPVDAQTGPAVRNDKDVIEKHLKMLEGKENLRDIYKFMTNSIYRYKK
ncbi:MAG: DUF2520 domain-containing protein [Bacteroidales bacterium]|jgi:predicted short-subunit dehydrogenase-like oxidoreductase (DUF2520 family)|nr:DUF2520 domain-containing protein [Bacteroidales bacterium]